MIRHLHSNLKHSYYALLNGPTHVQDLNLDILHVGWLCYCELPLIWTLEWEHHVTVSIVRIVVMGISFEESRQ